MFQVRQERTQWRDQSLSQRHRKYGWDSPAVDLDMILVEFSAGTPCALVEYKAVGAREVNLAHPTYVAIRKLADCARIPFLIAFYDSATWIYTITPANEFARAYVSETKTYSEREYVTLLYKMRGLEPEQQVLAELNDIHPDVPVAKKTSHLPPVPCAQTNRHMYANSGLYPKKYRQAAI